MIHSYRSSSDLLIMPNYRQEWVCAATNCTREPRCTVKVTEFPNDNEFPFICVLGHGEADFELHGRRRKIK